MITHHALASAISAEAVRQIRGQQQPWSVVLTGNVYTTSSRVWPQPDFVIVDLANNQSVAGEFKPPDQSKREYLTGLGQATAYTRDFDYAMLVVPEIADDGYRIADHILDVLQQPIMTNVPLALLVYDPRSISARSASFRIAHALNPRAFPVPSRANTQESFWAKWREASPEEVGRFLEYLYQEGRSNGPGTIRDRAFDLLWQDIVNGLTLHPGGYPRKVSNSQKNKTAWSKNFRNFTSHIGWTLADGKLTGDGLDALHVVHQYGAASRMFLDTLSLALLVAGKHLTLLNVINEFQEQRLSSKQPFADEQSWRDDIVFHLDQEGMIKRNPGRHAAALQNVPRDFFKAENQIWKMLELVTPSRPNGARVYHRSRGYVINWSRITALLSS